MRVPASVLLAVLAAAGLLALAPALVRRYDATERLAAERAQSTARVLQRRRRRRSVPGRKPMNPSRSRIVTLRAEVPPAGSPAADPAAGDSPVSGPPASTRRSRRLRAVPQNAGRARRRRPPARHTPAVYRRRRVFAALLLLNLVELIGVVVVSPGFWISFSVTGSLLGAYLVHLRGRAIADRRRRRAEAREAAWLAARQAEVRRAQARRAQARREAQRRLAAQREMVRRAALGMNRNADLPPAASGGGRAAASVSYRRAGGLRGRPYEAGRGPTAGQ
ncbi:hypothetical protein ACFP2T_02610 [Plantactinospora solaniradicis]|uniref:Uncharacterized protein n=1 Tax=Plantactinospora solaniradicis TaxID=1723736 RepID=A0ABW1K2B3_9ACTN